jgi:hypothetical protein
VSPEDIILEDKYFDELLSRIRSIRASEKRFYQQIREIAKIACYDYDNSIETRNFFATIQNKLHLAITGLTAAEIILERVDYVKSNMGLTTWNRSPTGNILQKDVTIAKNYYTEEEMGELNDLVTMYLDYAEVQAEKHELMFMQDWVTKLDEFLEFNDYEIFTPGQIFVRQASPQRKKADSYAIKHYKRYANQ